MKGGRLSGTRGLTQGPETGKKTELPNVPGHLCTLWEPMSSFLKHYELYSFMPPQKTGEQHSKPHKPSDLRIDT